MRKYGMRKFLTLLLLLTFVTTANASDVVPGDVIVVLRNT